MFNNTFLDIFFLMCLVNMWIVMLYQSFLLLKAYNFFLSARKKLDENLARLKDYPFVSILIPAHNEEEVIEGTMDTLLELDYPIDRMEIMVINDESTDSTGELIDAYANKFSRITPFHMPKGKGGKGKSCALNEGVKKSKGEVICVYDADNSPEPNSLKYLIAELVSDKRIVAVCGKVRTQNRKKNLLTRFINLEFISHQWIVQAGRWSRNKVTMLPGTNFVIEKDILKKLAGWDEKALTEDTELTLRILDTGKLISFNPFAITWEQEPESWQVWQRQRMRWMQGNQYIIKKYIKRAAMKYKSIRQILYMFSIYALLLTVVIMSDIIFILGVCNLIHINVSGPLLLTWLMAFLLFVITIGVTLSFEETTEATPSNLLIACLMYFTYSQMWVYLSLKGLCLSFIKKKNGPFWVKTPRVRIEGR